MPDNTPPVKRRGCLFYMGIAGLVFLLFLVTSLLVGIHYARKLLNEFTDTQPMTLPKVQMSEAQRADLNQRLDTFRQEVRAGRPTPPLTLNSDEINVLIATDPSLDFLKDKLYIAIEDSHLQGQMSIPLESLGPSRFKGRYLNGSGTFDLSLQNGAPQLLVQSLTIKGKPLPEAYMQRLRAQNLAQNVNNDARASAALNHLQSIQVKDGKLVVVPK